MQGTLFIISAPSGTGKTTLVKNLIETSKNLSLSVSYTTRSKRPGEIEGKHYHYVSQEVFEEMIEQNKFLEHANIYGNYYGTSYEWVEQRLAQGANIILEIDWQGAAQIKKRIANTVSIFILPPSPETLRQRLTTRDSDDLAIINLRLEHSQQEITHHNEYDYLVINDNFDVAMADLKAIIRATELYHRHQVLIHKELIAKFIA